MSRKSNWNYLGSVDCLRLRSVTVRGKESGATNKPGLSTGVPTRSYPVVRASDEEYPIAGIAREIGVSDGTLRSWVTRTRSTKANEKDSQ